MSWSNPWHKTKLKVGASSVIQFSLKKKKSLWSQRHSEFSYADLPRVFLWASLPCTDWHCSPDLCFKPGINTACKLQRKGTTFRHYLYRINRSCALLKWHYFCPSRFGSMVSACGLKGLWFNSGQGHISRLWVQSPAGGVQEALTIKSNFIFLKIQALWLIVYIH